MIGFLTQQEKLAGQALKHRLPSIYPQRDYVEVGGLMSYGESLKEFYRRAASFVDRIFRGARPADSLSRASRANWRSIARLRGRSAWRSRRMYMPRQRGDPIVRCFLIQLLADLT